MRLVAWSRSRLDSSARSINESSTASSKAVHQRTSSAGSWVGVLGRDEAVIRVVAPGRVLAETAPGPPGVDTHCVGISSRGGR